MPPRFVDVLTIPLLCSLSLQGCGTDPAVEESTTDPSSSGTGTGTGTDSADATTGEGDGDGDDDPTTTGPPDDNCGCADDEVCVATADSFCGPGFGYSTSCVSIDECEGACTCENICGSFCAPACDYADVAVDFWCDALSGQWCDIINQDCPEGEKCVPFGSTGEVYDERKCVPILGELEPGEACQSAGILEATDDCGADSFCYVPSAGETLCRPFCIVDQGCAQPDQSCLVSNEASILMCLANCDPLADMPCADELCGVNSNAGSGAPFICLPEPSGGIGQGDACDGVEDCAEGLICAQADVLDGCGSSACCTSLCELDDPGACAGLEPMMCLSYFEGEMAPMGYEQLGYCGVPQP